jgi:hypothetical protein
LESEHKRDFWRETLQDGGGGEVQGRGFQLDLPWMARAHVWMNPSVLGEHGVLMMHSFSFREALS